VLGREFGPIWSDWSVAMADLTAEYAFDDLQTKALGEAFDAICATVPDISYSTVVKEVIANKVIETAQQTGTSR
jgi:hypothetical protein